MALKNDCAFFIGINSQFPHLPTQVTAPKEAISMITGLKTDLLEIHTKNLAGEIM